MSKPYLFLMYWNYNFRNLLLHLLQLHVLVGLLSYIFCNWVLACFWCIQCFVGNNFMFKISKFQWNTQNKMFNDHVHNELFLFLIFEVCRHQNLQWFFNSCQLYLYVICQFVCDDKCNFMAILSMGHCVSKQNWVCFVQNYQLLWY